MITCYSLIVGVFPTIKIATSKWFHRRYFSLHLMEVDWIRLEIAKFVSTILFEVSYIPFFLHFLHLCGRTKHQKTELSAIYNSICFSLPFRRKPRPDYLRFRFLRPRIHRRQRFSGDCDLFWRSHRRNNRPKTLLFPSGLLN